MTDHAPCSLRLKKIAGMVTKGYRPADIGTDHAYLPIALISKGVCPSALCSDISDESVEKARRNIARAGLEEKIQVFKRDGLCGYRKRDADALVISGMGGPLMISVLDTCEDVAKSFKEIILSPQSELESVRVWLFNHGFRLIEEAMLRDGKHIYVIMKVCDGEETAYASDEAQRRIQFRYGPFLLEEKNPLLSDFLREEIERLDGAIAAVSAGKSERSYARAQELKKQKEEACSAMKLLII